MSGFGVYPALAGTHCAPVLSLRGNRVSYLTALKSCAERALLGGLGNKHAISRQDNRSGSERRAKDERLKDVLAEAIAGELVRNRPHTRFDLGDNFRPLGPDKA